MWGCLSVSEGPWGQAAPALLVEPLPLLPPRPALLPVQTWSGNYSQNLQTPIQEKAAGAAAPQHPNLPLCPLHQAGRMTHRHREPGSRDCGIHQGWDCRLPSSGATGTVNQTESDGGGCRLAREPGSPGVEGGSWGGTACGVCGRNTSQRLRLTGGSSMSILPPSRVISFAVRLFPSFPFSHSIRMM